MTKIKTIMMIGGGIQEVKAVEIAQSAGYKVIVTDQNEDAPGFPYADYTVTIDGRDIEGLIAYTLLKKEKLNIAGIFTLTELVTSVAAVASACDLPGVSIQSAVACQNKQLCKDIWINSKISTPNGKVVKTSADAKLFLKDLNNKAFIKPLVGFGGVGAREIHSQYDINEVFGNKSNQAFLMEELIEGSMHDVNGLIDENGDFHPMGIVDRFFMDNCPVEQAILTPSGLSVDKQNQLYNLLERAVRSLGINWGPVKGDAVLMNNEFKMLEVAPRLHGPKNSLYLLPFSGFNCLKSALSTITGNVAMNIDDLHQNKFCLCSAILPKIGDRFEVSDIKGKMKYRGIKELLIFFKEGDVIRKYENSTDVPAYIFSVGDSLEECRDYLLKTKM